jgi:predicted Zn-ribbon and HTH transcriptional regulator
LTEYEEDDKYYGIMKKNKCKRCGYEWKSMVKKPKSCPKCKSYFWDRERRRDG